MKTQQLKKWIGTVVVSGVLLLQTVHVSARQASTESLFDQFQQQEEVLRLQLETDLDLLQSDKRGESYIPAQLSFKDNNRQERSYSVEVKVRGRFRLMTCDFPPLKIKFSNTSPICMIGVSSYIPISSTITPFSLSISASSNRGFSTISERIWKARSSFALRHLM